MEYYVEHEGIESGETMIECELQIGDYCAIKVSDMEAVAVKIVKRTYYPDVKQWIFKG